MKLIYQVLEEISKKKSKKDKVAVLKENESWALKDIIRGSMDPTVKWNLPIGTPPHTKCEEHNAPANLHRENTKFTYFVKGGKGDSLPSYKRENIFLAMLEGIDPNDAELLIGMINKETPKGLTKPIVEEAFPGLLKG
tara:strand:- start:1548 stop:1961 length:414 start_codon:yes stop_codon:yes gene_type:complete